MAQPTAPTTTTLATEALKKAGHSNPSSAMLTRAWDYWGNEIKNDIWTVCKNLKMLQTSGVLVSTIGTSQYSFPSDYSRLISAIVMDYTITGTITTGCTAGIIKFASAPDITDTWASGKYLVIYVTTTSDTAYISQIYSYQSSPPQVLIDPAYSITPDATYSYMIVDVQDPLKLPPVWDHDNENYPMSKQKPISLHEIGDEDSGEFILFPAPDKTYPIFYRYYANLTTIDETGTLHDTVLNRWRNVFIQGMFAKQLQDDDDRRAGEEIKKYFQMVNMLSAREEYGMELSELQATVSL